MTLSALIEEFVDMKIEGEPQNSDWKSIVDCSKEREYWHNRLQELRQQIDGAIEAKLKEKNT